MVCDTTDVLPDLIVSGLRVVFCGSGGGSRSAKLGAYYADPRNQFWPTLYQTGLTPRLIKPEKFRVLVEFGIGLTDLNKHEFGMDEALSGTKDDSAGLDEKMTRFQPRVLAFSGKRPAKTFLGRSTGYGFQDEQIGATKIFVLPSPSGAGQRYWDVKFWHELADYVK